MEPRLANPKTIKFRDAVFSSYTHKDLLQSLKLSPIQDHSFLSQAIYGKPKLQHDLVACSNNRVMSHTWPLYVINTKCAKVTAMSCLHGWHLQVAPTCLHRRNNWKKEIPSEMQYCPYPLRATSMTVQIVGKFTPVCCMQIMCVRERIQHFFSSVCSLCEKPLTAP